MDYYSLIALFVTSILNYLVVKKFTEEKIGFSLKDYLIILLSTIMAFHTSLKGPDNLAIGLIKLVFLNSLIILSFIDIKKMIVPDQILIVSFVLITLIRLFFREEVREYLLYGAVSFLILFLVYNIYEDKLGGGDVKLVGLLGLVGGVENVFLSLFYASTYALIAFLFFYIKGEKIGDKKIPFIPFITLGVYTGYYFNLYNMFY